MTQLRKVQKGKFSVLENSPELTLEQLRGLAVGGPYSQKMDMPVNALTTGYSPEDVAPLLSGAWGIRSGEEAIETFEYLLTEGDRGMFDIVHPAAKANAANVGPSSSNPLMLMVQSFKNMFNMKKIMQQGQELLNKLEKDAAARGIDAEEAKKVFTTWAGVMMSASAGGGLLSDAGKFLPESSPSSVAAWDAARVVHVARMAFDAGYIDEQVAWNAIYQAAALSKQHYSSWNDFSVGFYYGRAFWYAMNNPQEPTHADNYDYWLAIENLLNAKQDASPWNTVSF